MVKRKIRADYRCLGELAQQGKRMKERPKENKKVLNAKNEVTKESIRRKMNKDAATFLDY